MANYVTPQFPSLAAAKTDRILAKAQQKTQKLASDNGFQPFDLGYSDPTNAIDLAQASGIRALGNLSDAGANVSNYVFGTDFDSSQQEGWSNPATAEEMAGVAPEYRQQFQQDQDKVLQSLAAGNYLGAARDAFNVGLRTAADSAATLPEVAAGVVLTALAPQSGAGEAILAKKGKDAYDTVTAISKRYKQLKKLAETGTKAVAKSAGQSSLLVADLTQQQVADYQQLNNGELPSASRTASMVLGNLATSTIELGIIKKLFIPKYKKEFVDQATKLAKHVTFEPSAIKSIGSRIADATAKAVKAGGAEAGQEYLQTWQEILSVRTDPKSGQSLWDAVAEQLNGDNNLQALQGAFLGGAAGGTTRGAISAPSLATGVAADTAVGTAKTASKLAKNVANANAARVADKLLSPEEKAAIAEDYKVKETVVNQKIDDLKTKAETVQKATSFHDLAANEEFKAEITDLQEKAGVTAEDLKNQKVFKEFKKALASRYTHDQNTLKRELKTSKAATVAKKVGSNIKTKATTVADTALDKVPETTKEAILSTIKNPSEKIREAINGIESSTALGLIELGSQKTKSATKLAVKTAKDIRATDLDRAAAVLSKTNPTLAKHLKSVAEKKRALLKRQGVLSDNIIDDKNIPSELGAVAKTKHISEKEAPAVGVLLGEAFKGKIKGKKAIKALETSLQVYKNTDTFRNQSEGAVSPTTVKVWEQRLAKAKKRYKAYDVTAGIAAEIAKQPKRIKKFIDGLEDKEVAEVLQDIKGKLPDNLQSKYDAIEETASIFAKDVRKRVQKDKPKKKKTKKQKTVSPKVEVKTVKESKLRVVLEGINDGVSKDTDVSGIVEQIPLIAKKLKKEGYTEMADVEQLFQEYPNIASNTTLKEALQLHLIPDIVIDDIAPDVPSKQVSEQEADDFYNKMFPDCK